LPFAVRFGFFGEGANRSLLLFDGCFFVDISLKCPFTDFFAFSHSAEVPLQTANGERRTAVAPSARQTTAFP
jgi:hypothetical protein